MSKVNTTAAALLLAGSAINGASPEAETAIYEPPREWITDGTEQTELRLSSVLPLGRVAVGPELEPGEPTKVPPNGYDQAAEKRSVEVAAETWQPELKLNLKELSGEFDPEKIAIDKGPLKYEIYRIGPGYDFTAESLFVDFIDLAEGEFRASYYIFQDEAAIESVYKAIERGVTVKNLVVEGTNTVNPNNSQSGLTHKMLEKVNKKAGEEVVTFCQASCFNERGNNHAKVFTIERAGDDEHLAVITSANLSVDNQAYDVAVVIKNNREVYDLVSSYIDDQAVHGKEDKTVKDYGGFVFLDANAAIYFGPGREEPYTEILDRANCDHRGRPNKFKKIAMTGLFDKRSEVIGQLGDLSQAGCEVDTITNIYRSKEAHFILESLGVNSILTSYPDTWHGKMLNLIITIEGQDYYMSAAGSANALGKPGRTEDLAVFTWSSVNQGPTPMYKFIKRYVKDHS
ncbi:MAG TPA: phospholipase D-like domain-containing protein [Candidatus Saccharimonadales bacterium]